MRALAIMLAEGIEEVADVACGEVEALGAGRRHDMGGVAREKEPAEAHRLGDEAAQRGDALLKGRPGRHRVGDLAGQAPAQLVEEGAVRPILGPLAERNLDIVAAAPGRAHRAQGEAAFVMGIDQLMCGGRPVDQQAEPAEGIGPLEALQGARRDGAARHAVIAVAAGDEVAAQLPRLSFRPKGHAR